MLCPLFIIYRLGSDVPYGLAVLNDLVKFVFRFAASLAEVYFNVARRSVYLDLARTAILVSDV